MAWGTAIIMVVMMGPRELGRMWRKMMDRSGTPMVRAASTYSRPLNR